ARDFTWERVEAVLDAIAVHLLSKGETGVVVGSDTRFLSPEMAADAAGRLASAGFKAILADRPTPTPVLSHAVRSLGLGGVVNFTASHNPFSYNGIKFSPSHGGPAGSDVTSSIEALIESGARPEQCSGGSVEQKNLIDPYIEALGAFFDRKCIGGSALRVVYDPFNGTGAGLLDGILRSSGAAVRTIHEARNPLFDGRHPEPNENGMRDVSREVVRSRAGLGLATDGDADRFGITDENGVFVSPHDYLALLLCHLVEKRGGRGRVVRSVSTGTLLDRAARELGMDVVETPVGFKYLGAEMLEGGVLLAGEESGGLSVGGHVPEKDGILACLLAAEIVASSGRGLSALLEELWARFGRLFHRRLDIALTEETRRRVSSALLEAVPPELGGARVASTDNKDGRRFMLEGGGWVLVRLSGTEPLARIYLEAPCERMLSSLEEHLRDLLERGV
ncbi:phosphoglucomutase/phosphomannomutase family protein, partial [Candidatus Fermentibacteria bacterium]|nr:phosphoglucomutase/phosphomannomutase family protein [Candidatus Fermentibacteria bacterium]